MSDSLEQRYATTPYYGGNATFLEDIYERYLIDPASVEPHWREYFRQLEATLPGRPDVPHGPIIEELAQRARRPHAATTAGGVIPREYLEKQAAVMRLIEAYRLRGHQRARLDPLGLQQQPEVPDLDPAYHGLGESDMDTEFSTLGLVGPDRMKLRDIVALLRQVYCGTIGFEYIHVTNPDERRWLKERIEGVSNRDGLSADEKRLVLTQLIAAEGMEKYLHTRYVGQKRFSLEGGESMVPLLGEIIQRAGSHGMKEIVIGMAHRGRLNVLINVLGKSPKDLFSEFEGIYDPKLTDRSGDVKYHLGFSSDIRTPGGNVHVVLAFNPSHLEIVDPVVEGSVRARQDRRKDADGSKVMPVLIHGDAAFAGQGVVMETLQLSQARGFRTGGTVHIVCNNQIGFTISDPRDARSTPYCTDIGKMIEAPVFHVNADDVEAVIHVARLALDYRLTFHKDVIIDLVCYRRHGHNEADEPAATQPIMYQVIKAHPTTRALYAERLQREGVITAEEATAIGEEYRKGLDEGRTVAPAVMGMTGDEFTVNWSKYNKVDWDHPADTAVPLQRIRSLGEPLVNPPDGFELHPRVQRIVEDRRRMLSGDMPLDWGFAETLAYATLLTDNFSVRISGQDSGRGTFFHRHAVWYNQKDGSTHIPLRNLGVPQAPFTIIDSLLSEEAVVGFEYGYSTADPNALVIWEAQFGDFANGAQVVIDQFISSGEAKWGRMCGLVMFLPHGYEGQGPEHSSARLERYLQLCAQHNMQVCVPSTPAQMFHMLRRQMVRPLRKPLIVMTPKSLLRHRLSVSSLEDLTNGHFRNIIPEVDDIKPAKVERVVFCSGKVYFDLLEARRAEEREDVAIVRIEQLYPFPQKEYEEIIDTYSYARDIVWCQEEPENQGAWYQIRHRLQAPLKSRHTLSYAGRAASASTAAGYFNMHVEQQKALIAEALQSVQKKPAAGMKAGKIKAKA